MDEDGEGFMELDELRKGLHDEGHPIPAILLGAYSTTRSAHQSL
jgi:hypothetical protein